MRILFILLFFTLSTFAQRQVTVFFDFDKSDLTPIAQEQLKSVFSNPQLRTTAIGKAIKPTTIVFRTLELMPFIIF